MDDPGSENVLAEKSGQPIQFDWGENNLIEVICDALRGDGVALVQNVPSDQSDRLMSLVSRQFRLSDRLELQAGFASSLGHRQNVGQYFMTVNRRDNYQFVPAHSEGSVFSHMELGAFYCGQNTTDGGATLLFNVDDLSYMWPSLREKVRRGKLLKPLSRSSVAKARAKYRLSLPTDVLETNDEVLSEESTDIDGLVLVNALATPRRIYSSILGRQSFAYWNSISQIDADSAQEFCRLLVRLDLLRQPTAGLPIDLMDYDRRNRIRKFGVRYAEIFRRIIVRKLKSNEMILFNNVTWSHSASNWTPGSGIREVIASFA